MPHEIMGANKAQEFHILTDALAVVNMGAKRPVGAKRCDDSDLKVDLHVEGKLSDFCFHHGKRVSRGRR
jgi:hypothetical protein